MGAAADLKDGSQLVKLARALARSVAGFEAAAPVSRVYNPLDYAWKAHRLYLEGYATRPVETLLVGMNPGPWGMAQTGVPFGDVVLVREWMGIHAQIDAPEQEHPKRPVLGFECHRREVSGQRFWGWARDRFRTPDRFFQRFFVWNYCPLMFLEASGRNRTPDKLWASEREALFQECDRALAGLAAFLQPRYVVGIGKFAAERAEAALGQSPRAITFGRVLHPSPASPLANSGWADQMDAALCDLGIKLRA